MPSAHAKNCRDARGPRGGRLSAQARRFGRLAAFAAFAGLSGCSLFQQTYVARYHGDDRILVIEVLEDDLVRFELLHVSDPAGVAGRIPVTPMVERRSFRGPARLRDNRRGMIETADLRIEVDEPSLAVTISARSDRPDAERVTMFPLESGNGRLRLGLRADWVRHAYGLGQQFLEPGRTDGDWLGQVRRPASSFGNGLVKFNGGSVGNTQFPILIAEGPRGAFGVFVDDVHAQMWDFTKSPWDVQIACDVTAWYFLGGDDLRDIRRDQMELVGRPPVPPRKMFGLWVSEYGYDDWAELTAALASLRSNGFPVDGFVLDLQWFGGIAKESELSRMGRLAWDESRFVDPAGRVAALEQEHGVGLMLIEESYVSRGLSEYEVLRKHGCLVQRCDTDEPVDFVDWWGAGGMLDWINDAGADFWHDWKRLPHIEMGVLGHWTDLGEPERFDPRGCYFGGEDRPKRPHAAVHNLYNFKWAESIARGYRRHGLTRRPFILTRSGTSGVQRFGAAMWSGDIASNLSSLAAHLQAQMNMCMSGVDYYGSDIGGYYRPALDGDANECYTRWFAHGALFDVPVRPHTANLEDRYETAPDRIGDVRSNLASLRRRYELIPYLYSLAHRAWRDGEPVFPPAFHEFGRDSLLAGVGSLKMIGRDVLVACVPEYHLDTHDVYLPAGRWYDYDSHDVFDSDGGVVPDVPLRRDGLFRLPMFVRAGAILPLMYVDEKTMNAFGRRTDGTVRDELRVRVYGDARSSSFTLFEDDGRTIGYQSGAVRATEITQVRREQRVRVTIGRAEGTYEGAPVDRDNVVILVTDAAARVSAVQLDGRELPRWATDAEFDGAPRGWHQPDAGPAKAKSGRMPVRDRKVFDFELGR